MKLYVFMMVSMSLGYSRIKLFNQENINKINKLYDEGVLHKILDK